MTGALEPELRSPESSSGDSRLGADNYAKERNLRINNGNLDNEGVKNYNLRVKDYYFDNTLGPF